MPFIGGLAAAKERLGGRPRELYTFSQGANLWRYCSGSGAVTAQVRSGGPFVTWVAAPCRRANIIKNAEAKSVIVHGAVGLNTPVGQFMTDVHTTQMSVGIHRHQDFPDAYPFLIAYGDVINTAISGAWVEFDVQTSDSSLERPWPRLTVERLCPLVTYEIRCGVKEADFTITAVIADIARSVITLSTLSAVIPDDWASNGGQLVVAPAGVDERIYVDKQIGNELTIFGEIPTGVSVGDACKLIAGDDHTPDTCKNKFANLKRYLGFPNLPAEDPLQQGFS